MIGQETFYVIINTLLQSTTGLHIPVNTQLWFYRTFMITTYSHGMSSTQNSDTTLTSKSKWSNKYTVWNELHRQPEATDIYKHIQGMIPCEQMVNSLELC